MRTLVCIWTVATALFLPSYTQAAMTINQNFDSIDSGTYMDIVVEKSGDLRGIRSEFLKVTVKGESEFDDCCIKKDFISFGNVDANDTVFEKDVCVYSGEAVFNSCDLPSLYVFDGSESCPVIELQGQTTILGNIVFETGEGKVYKSPEVVINGEVIGGTIHNLSESIN